METTTATTTAADDLDTVARILEAALTATKKAAELTRKAGPVRTKKARTEIEMARLWAASAAHNLAEVEELSAAAEAAHVDQVRDEEWEAENASYEPSIRYGGPQ